MSASRLVVGRNIVYFGTMSTAQPGSQCSTLAVTELACCSQAVIVSRHPAYCPDVMKQLAAVQGLLEGASRIMLRRHLETCVATAMREGRTAEIVDELMETLKFDRHVFRPAAVPGADATDAAPELPGVAS